MTILRTKKLVCVVFAGLLAGCASTQDVDAINERLSKLEEKMNTALQSSAEARIDARTALKIATE